MILIFNGAPGTGKDELCSYLSEKYKFTHLRFKDQLFLETAAYYGVDEEWFITGYNDRIVREIPIPELDNKSMREALQYVGEKIIKPKYGKEYFGQKTLEKLDATNKFCISDCGFLAEIDPIINKFGVDKLVLIQIFRDKCSFETDTRRYINATPSKIFEIGFETIPKQSEYTYETRKFPNCQHIHNNGSLEHLHEVMDFIYTKEQNV